MQSFHIRIFTHDHTLIAERELPVIPAVGQCLYIPSTREWVVAKVVLNFFDNHKRSDADIFVI